MSEKKVIVVTGVSRGIGRAMVAGFAAGGHTVCGCARASDTVGELATTYPAPHSFESVDVANRSQVDAWATRSLERHGPPDLLINNAGVINVTAPLWEVPAEEFETVINVNVLGTVNVSRAFLPAMIERGRGVVVNMSSGWGRSASPEVAPYCASKYAVEGLTSSLAQELPAGLAAVALSPGVIDTDMLRSCWGDTAAAQPHPDQWAATAVPFLLSLDESHNGKSMRVEM